MAFGTFDLLHEGHKYYLKKCRGCGDYLIAIVARDSTTVNVKGRKPLQNQKKRLQQVQALPFVDNAVLGQEGDKWKIIEEHKPDILCLGYDQKYFTENLEEGLKQRGLQVRVVRIKPHQPEIYKTSKLREREHNI